MEQIYVAGKMSQISDVKNYQMNQTPPLIVSIIVSYDIIVCLHPLSTLSSDIRHLTCPLTPPETRLCHCGHGTSQQGD